MRAWRRGEQRLSPSSGGSQEVVHPAYGDPTFTTAEATRFTEPLRTNLLRGVTLVQAVHRSS